MYFIDPHKQRQVDENLEGEAFPCLDLLELELLKYTVRVSSSLIVAAFTMLTYLQSLQRHPVQNREIKFYKGFFLEKKTNIKYLSFQKETIV